LTAAMSEEIPGRIEDMHPLLCITPPKVPRSRPSLRVIGSYHLGGPGKGGRCPNFALTCHNEGDVCFRCINSRLLPSEWRYFLKARRINEGKFSSIIDNRGISELEI